MSLNDFLPHSICLAADPLLIWLHAGSDAITALAYYSIPIALFVLAARRADLEFRWVLLLFGAFVLACGTTHILGLVTLWEPEYLIAGWVKAATAVISMVTAVVLWKILPNVIAWPSHTQLQREIEERKRVEAELRDLTATLEVRVAERTEEVEAANRAKTEFFASASHDLRQPLQSLRLFVDVLSAANVPHQAQRAVQGASQALASAEGLIHSLLDVARIEAGVAKMAIQPFCLDNVFEQFNREFAKIAHNKGLSFRVRRSTATVHSDRQALERILRNLIANAIRYTDKGGVLVGSRRRGSSIVIEVRDTGRGIAEDQLANIWEEFVQLHNSARDRNEGLGLGLAIVKKLTTSLGHKVEVWSKPGKGTVFRVHVPAEPIRQPFNMQIEA